LKELVEYVARSIASRPDDVIVTQEEDESGLVVLKLEVAPEDKGKIIGRHGNVAKSIRLLLRVAAVKQSTRVVLEIL
tara:strand:- start:284 stop:514 length:231 start_codon:yes stop_codon:yes gene_type:complete